jgi:putative antitoxin of VapBC-like toxin-antitoxin system
MAFTTLTIRDDVARRLKKAKAPGESYSDILTRLLDEQPAKTGGEWLDSLAPLEGRGIFSPAAREKLRADQRAPRSSPRKRRAAP